MPTETQHSVSDVRQILDRALTHYLTTGACDPADQFIVLAMAENPRRWTHTTRLREFIEGVNA